MIKFVFSSSAKKIFSRFEPQIQKRIISKLKLFKNRSNLRPVLKKLSGFTYATHRLRIGDYRLILKKEEPCKFLIVDIGHRREVYR